MFVQYAARPKHLRSPMIYVGTGQSAIDLTFSGSNRTPCLPTMQPRSEFTAENMPFLRMAYTYARA